jgi:hypothetical protein
MVHTYTLTEAEASRLAKIRQQFQDLTEALETVTKNRIAVEGAYNGCLTLIATQQGLTPSGNETISLSGDVLTVSIVDEPETGTSSESEL